jgi:hypothetical protein
LVNNTVKVTKNQVIKRKKQAKQPPVLPSFFRISDKKAYVKDFNIVNTNILTLLTATP